MEVSTQLFPEVWTPWHELRLFISLIHYSMKTTCKWKNLKHLCLKSVTMTTDPRPPVSSNPPFTPLQRETLLTHPHVTISHLAGEDLSFKTWELYKINMKYFNVYIHANACFHSISVPYCFEVFVWFSHDKKQQLCTKSVMLLVKYSIKCLFNISYFDRHVQEEWFRLKRILSLKGDCLTSLMNWI